MYFKRFGSIFKEVRINRLYKGGIMGIPITAAGNIVNTVSQQELPQETAVRHAAIRSTAADLEQVSQVLNHRLKFVVDHESHEVTVKVIDPETDKVIKILPPEELQRLHTELTETMGFLFDERV
jgi:flagellar protein FlaG